MADGDRNKTIKLSKGGGKAGAPPAGGGSAAETRKHADPPPPKPSGSGDQAKTQAFRAGSGAGSGNDANAPATPSPAPSPVPAASAPEPDNQTRVYRPGAPSAGAAEVNESPAPASDPQAEEDRISNPVVGWLVVVSGPGSGGYRGIFDGRNRIGRAASADIPLDFGDTGISKEQAIIHYDPKDRKFLFIPQLDVENFTYVNQEKPTAPVELKALDEIEMAATTLRFVPLCGPKFNWSDLDKK